MTRNSLKRQRYLCSAALGVGVALLLCSFAAASPTDLDPSLDLWPIIRVWSPPLKLPESHGEALYPVVEWHGGEMTSQFFLRPIYSRRNDKFNQVIEWDFFWPFVFGTGRPDLRGW